MSLATAMSSDNSQNVATTELNDENEQLESAFAEFMSRYSVKSTPAPPQEAPAKSAAAVASKKVAAPAKPAVPSSSAPVANLPAAAVASPRPMPAKSSRESVDALRQLRVVANDITRSVLVNHQTTESRRRITAYFTTAVVTNVASIAASTVSSSAWSSTYAMSVLFLLISIGLMFRVAAEKQKHSLQTTER